MTQKVAVFDVDGTIFRSSLLIQIVERLIFIGAFPESVRDEFEKQRLKWLDRKGDYDDYILAVVQSFLTHIKGMHYGVLADAAETVVGEQRNHVYRYTRDLLKDLKKKKYFLLAVSHSPKTILDKFCPAFGFDKVYGTLYETGPTDAFTGDIMESHLIFNKAAVLKRAVEKGGLTLKESVGVGDTESDIPFLELVDTAICFNPNSKLYKHARREKWKVVVERKDVIYEL
jgi:HAD superfamily phosphoserine phosphatase-like hydrolase